LVGLQPDIILTFGATATAAVQREARTIPIVFVNALDPVATGLVPGLNRPGENTTGFAGLEPSMAGKWLELPSEIAPGLKRAAIMFNPGFLAASVFMPPLETAARSLKVVPIAAPVHSDVEIETAINALGREPGGGLVVPPDVFLNARRALIILAAARNNVPAVSPECCLCQRRRLALLRTRLGRHLASLRRLFRSHSARREAGRSPGAVSDQVRDGPDG
jgi:putative ABC transport system substrate-binding protein